MIELRHKIVNPWVCAEWVFDDGSLVDVVLFNIGSGRVLSGTGWQQYRSRLGVTPSG